MKVSLFPIARPRPVPLWKCPPGRVENSFRRGRRFPFLRFGMARVAGTLMVIGLGLLSTNRAFAQVNVDLTLNKAAPQRMNIPIEWEKTADDRLKKGSLPGGIQIQLTRLGDDGYEIRLDSNADGSLDDEVEHPIYADQDLAVEIERRFSKQRSEWLPYTITYRTFTDRKGKRQEHFHLTPQYQAEGLLKLGSCSAVLLLLDLNGDGLFDQKDGKGGSNLGLDMDGDQKINGRDEWHRDGAPIHFCEKDFTISILENDGSKLVLNKSDVRRRLAPNTPLPFFNFETNEGKTIYSHHLKSKAHLFAFWATWSKQSLRNIDPLKQLKHEFGEDLAVIAVNVDKEPQIANAKNMARLHNGDWDNVILGKGSKDPVWQQICDTTGAPNVVPYYVILDPKGFIHYHGTGGKKLEKVRGMLYKLYPAKDPRFIPKDKKSGEGEKPDPKAGAGTKKKGT